MHSFSISKSGLAWPAVLVKEKQAFRGNFFTKCCRLCLVVVFLLVFYCTPIVVFFLSFSERFLTLGKGSIVNGVIIIIIISIITNNNTFQS